MKKLFLITQFYPYENNEEPFILPELVRLKKEFDVTVIVADADGKENIGANIPTDIKVVKYSSNDVKIVWNYYKRIGYRCSRICKEAKNKDEFNKRYYAKGKTFEYWFRKQRFVKKNEEFIIYSYWFLWWNLGFAENKVRYPRMKLITRTHGFDLYDERHRDGKQPFRKYLDSKMDKVFFVSEMGREYYIERQANHPVQKDKYVVSYLGQEDCCGDAPQKTGNELFTIVSCSNVIPLKRVELIAKALGEIRSDRSVKWVHFGDGPSMEEVKKEAEKACDKNGKLLVELKGRVTNNDVLQFYRNNHVDTFITTSSTEGLPVSISEAMCFGIPIIATDVGGIKEQFNGNGIMLSSNPSISEIGEAILKLTQLDIVSLHKMGQISRNIWKEKFDADINAYTFIEAIN